MKAYEVQHTPGTTRLPQCHLLQVLVSAPGELLAPGEGELPRAGEGEPLVPGRGEPLDPGDGELLAPGEGDPACVSHSLRPHGTACISMVYKGDMLRDPMLK